MAPSPDRAPDGLRRHAPGETAVCVFAFVPGELEPETALATAPQGPQIWAHQVGSIAALANLVPLADYVGGEAQANLADIEWLAPRTLCHADLLQQAMRRSPVFPMPFGTLFSSIAGLSAFMTAHEAAIARFLRNVAGKEEWGLKARAPLDRPATAEAMAKASWPDWPSLTPGVRYMRVRRDHHSLVALARERALDAVAALVSRFQALEAEIRLLPPRRDSGEAGELIASYALLIPTSAAPARRTLFEGLSAEGRDAGVTMAVSGPWPPFSFRPRLQQSSREDEVRDGVAPSKH